MIEKTNDVREQMVDFWSLCISMIEPTMDANPLHIAACSDIGTRYLKFTRYVGDDNDATIQITIYFEQ